MVETAVTVLQEKMQMLAAAPAHQTQSAESHAQVVVLQADLSGFTAMSAEMDAEQVRDTVNALWEKLDSVAHSWGGVIDKHTGDGFIALFGVPMAQEDDAERAILAALDMQLELALFNDLSRRRIETGPLDRRKVVGEMKMRWPGQPPYDGAYHDLFPSWKEFWATPPEKDKLPQVASPAPLEQFLATLRRGAPIPKIKVR